MNTRFERFAHVIEAGFSADGWSTPYTESHILRTQVTQTFGTTVGGAACGDSNLPVSIPAFETSAVETRKRGYPDHSDPSCFLFLALHQKSTTIMIPRAPRNISGLANHVWSVAGSDNRYDFNSTFIQPFINYTKPTAVTYALNMEASYDWESEQWAIPVNLMVSKLKRFDKQMVSFQGGIRYRVESTDSGPEGLGLRFAVTLLFSK